MTTAYETGTNSIENLDGGDLAIDFALVEVLA